MSVPSRILKIVNEDAPSVRLIKDQGGIVIVKGN
jgi:hypothetical protein